jgi:hypothetical protein
MRFGWLTGVGNDPQHATLEVDLLPTPGDQFRHAEPVARGEEQHGRVPMAMPPEPPHGRDQCVDCLWCEIVAAPSGGMRVFP